MVRLHILLCAFLCIAPAGNLGQQHGMLFAVIVACWFQCSLAILACPHIGLGGTGHNWLQVLQAYLEQFICNEAVGSAGPPSRALPGTKGLMLPCSTDPADYTAVVNSLPDTDSPALFGLPANVHRAAGRSTSSAVVVSLQRINASKVSHPLRTHAMSHLIRSHFSVTKRLK